MMRKESLSVLKLVRCAVVAAIYVALCLGLAPFSYGAIQVRVAEDALRRARVKGLAIPAALPPILWNAAIVGPEIAIFFSDSPATPALVLFNALTVGAGEVISCGVLGVALARLIESDPRLRRLFSDEGVRTA